MVHAHGVWNDVEDFEFVLSLLSVGSRHSLSQYETAHNTRQAVVLVYEGFITIRISIDHLHMETRYESLPGRNALALLVMVLASYFRSAPSTRQDFTHTILDPAIMSDARIHVATR